jgi:glucose-1-phosphate thymidylyltransferase
MNIIIPMAGMGKRMRPHTLTTPKPLIPIAGKPMVHRIVEDIAATSNEPIDNIGFICGQFGEQAEKELVAVAESLGAKGHIFYQDTPKGTAHAILCAQELLKGHVFLAFADTLFDAHFTIDTNKDAIIWTQKIDNPSAFGVVVLNEDGSVNRFEEKPKVFVSDLAIIGVYYFKDGENLRSELQYLLDNNITGGGEYQLTDAMENMRAKGLGFYTGQVDEWLDCGNKDATLFTMERILALKQGKETLVSASAKITNSTIIEPCFIGEGATVTNSVVGPYASIEAGANISGSLVKYSIIRNGAAVQNANLHKSLIGSFASVEGNAQETSLSDYSTLQA